MALLHIFGELVLMIPFLLNILKYKLKPFDRYGILLIIVGTLIIDGYLLISWFMEDTQTNGRKEMIKKLLRGSSRYAQASRQDLNNLIAVLHGNYGAAYYFVLQDLFDDEEIDEIIGSREKRKQFETEIINIQDEMTRKAVKDCPQYAGVIDFLSELAGES